MKDPVSQELRKIVSEQSTSRAEDLPPISLMDAFLITGATILVVSFAKLLMILVGQ